METKRICPSCQKTLPPNVPLGLCPECLIKSGFNTGTEPGNPGKERGFVPPPVEEIRSLFPQLEIIELIGKGGMGAVYKARQPTLDRFVALKILPPGAADDAGFAERFNREARALARLNHPHIVAVHDFGQAGSQPYLVMEFVDGPNLRQVEQAGRLTPEQALEIVPQICEALQFAHNEGVVHRDIKPENILLDKKGRVKITDFGIAKILGVPSGKASLTGAKDFLGTPHYMAPEQVERPQTVDHRADIYSLGVVFYELLTGELPLGKFQAPSKKVHMDVRLDDVVLRTLENEPDRRYQHASEVQTDVETIAHTQGAAPSTSAPDAPGSSGVAAVWGQVKGPAMGLVVTGILNWLAIPLFVLVAAWVASGTGAVNGYVLFVPLAALVLSSVMIVAGLKMKRLEAYGLAIVGSILAMLVTPGNVIGLPLGIWALVVLSHREVRAAFGKHHPLPPVRPESPPANRSGGAWKVAAVIAAAVMLILALPVGTILLSIALPALSRQRAHVAAHEATQVAAVEEKLRQEIGRRLGEAHISFRSVFVSVSPLLSSAECQFDGLRKEVSQNLFEDVAGDLDIRPAGNALWSVKGKGGLGHVSFTVDTSAEMAAGRGEPPPMTAQKASFGPVREVTLNDIDELRGGEALDLDGGKLVDSPKDMEKRPEPERLQWLKDQSADLLLDNVSGRWGLMTIGDNELKLAPLLNNSWEASSESSLSNALAGPPGGVKADPQRMHRVYADNKWELVRESDLPYQLPQALEFKQRGAWRVYVLATNAQPPQTFAFKTASGASGLLQITEFTEKPNSARLRYKLSLFARMSKQNNVSW